MEYVLILFYNSIIFLINSPFLLLYIMFNKKRKHITFFNNIIIFEIKIFNLDTQEFKLHELHRLINKFK